MISPTWTVYDTLFSTIFWLTGITGFVGNSILIWLIFNKSPQTLSFYRVFLLNAAITDFVYTVAITFTQIRLIPVRWAFLYVPLGPARYFGAWAGYYGYCILLHAIFYTFLSFPLSFGFRHHVLVKPTPKIIGCILICILLWILALIQHVMFVYSETPASELLSYLHQYKPECNLTGWTVSGNSMITQPLTAVTLATIVIPMFPIYVLVVYFYNKVHGHLSVNQHSLGVGTIRRHRRLIQALKIQASLPLLFIFPPITIYLLYHLEIIQFHIIEYSVYVLFSFYPATSPFVTMYYVKPYHVAIRKILRLFRRVSPVKNQQNRTQYSTTE